MFDFLISKEQARQFAYDCFDVILKDMKVTAEQEGDKENNQEEPKASA